MLDLPVARHQFLSHLGELMGVQRKALGIGVFPPAMDSYWDFDWCCWVESDKELRERILNKLRNDYVGSSRESSEARWLSSR